MVEPGGEPAEGPAPVERPAETLVGVSGPEGPADRVDRTLAGVAGAFLGGVGAMQATLAYEGWEASMLDAPDVLEAVLRASLSGPGLTALVSLYLGLVLVLAPARRLCGWAVVWGVLIFLGPVLEVPPKPGGQVGTATTIMAGAAALFAWVARR